MEKLNLPETAAHHSIALTGGFFGIYALLLRSGRSLGSGWLRCLSMWQAWCLPR